MNFEQIWWKFWRKLKFEILNPKIQNLTKSQNLKSLTLKSKIFNFDKIWQKIKIPPRWFIITLRFHQNSKVKIFQNLSQYGVTTVTKTFSKFWSRYQNHQNLQNWLSSPKFWRKFLKHADLTSFFVVWIFAKFDWVAERQLANFDFDFVNFVSTCGDLQISAITVESFIKWLFLKILKWWAKIGNLCWF